MLAKSESQTLAALSDLTPEIFEQNALTETRRSALATAQQLGLPFWRRTDLKDFKPDTLRPTYGAVEIHASVEQGVYVADFQTALREKGDLVARYFGTAVPSDLNSFVAYNTALAN
ncbi:MAG: hypothetical protein JOZ51_18460, partial [Chloroflexi bacterium]|nr:hypothetical protein [Chloroflexota bacterium]